MLKRKKPIVINTKPRYWARIKRANPLSLIPAGIFTAIGLAKVCFSILYMLGINLLDASHHSWKDLLTGGVFAFMGGLYFLLYFVARRLTPEEQLHERLNADYVTLNEVMRKNDVQPRYIINGERYYAPMDFGDIATLLRASIAPAASQEVLLRPATGNVETHQDQLLRAAEDIGEVTTVPQPLSLEAPPVMPRAATNASSQPQQILLNGDSSNAS